MSVAQSHTKVETRIRFWGVRGSIPAPGPETVRYGGNTSCVEVRAGNEVIILDAGTGIRGLGLALAREFKDKPLSLTLLITHTHWDHIQGFPFFAPAWDARTQVRILGYDGAGSGLRQTLAGQMESPYFPVSMQEMPGNVQIEELQTKEFQIGSIPVHACEMNHPGVAVGYRIETPAGSVVYVPDNEPCGPNGTPECDTAELSEKLFRFISGADILIADSQYNSEEYATKVGWGHGCVCDVAEMAMRAGVKRLFLFHHDPSHSDSQIDDLLKDAREIVAKSGVTLQVDAAREGEEIILTA